jgi:hypothetical protein
MKYQGIAAELLAQRAAGCATLAVVHFNDTKDRLLTSFEADGVAWTPIDRPSDLLRGDSVTATSPQTRTGLLHSATLLGEAAAIAAENLPADAARLHVAVAEMYPLPDRDDLVRSFLASLPLRCRLCWHISLDEAVLQTVGRITPLVVELLEQLGFKDDQCIEHPMLQQSIRKAQEKIKRQTVGDEAAESAQAWLDRNLRS